MKRVVNGIHEEKESDMELGKTSSGELSELGSRWAERVVNYGKLLEAIFGEAGREYMGSMD